MGNTSVAKRDKYVRGLDGMRALAIIMVLAYHLRMPFAKGGISGVTIFFVLSGFLITRNLLKEMEENDTINLKKFWVKRIQRLYPVMLTMIVVLVLISAVTNRVLFTKACNDIPSALLGYNNWWQIFNNVSYFNRSGVASPLMHFWSLAIEMQFYLLYPLLLLGVSKMKKDRKMYALVVLVLGVISAAMMWILFDPTKDPSRLYYGTDTRIFSLLLGALPAFMESEIRRKGSAKGKTVLSIILFAILLWSMIFVDGYSRGGQIVVTILGVLLIALFVDRRNRFGALLSAAPLKWLAERSYGIYIWHFPIILLMSGGKRVGFFIVLLELVSIFVVSEVSYRCLEVPARNGVFKKTLRKIRRRPKSEKEKKQQVRLIKRVKAITVCAGAFILAALLCVAFVPRKTIVVGQKKTESKKETKKKVSQKPKENEHILSELELLLVGDSIAADGAESFNAIFTNSICDTKIGRNAYEAPGIVEKYMKEYDWNGDAVILSLAINGPLNNSLEEVREVIGKDKPLFIVTGKAPYEIYEEPNNKQIHEFAKNTKHTYVIDWYDYSSDHPEYFDQDETHLLPEGGQAYTDCIKKEVLKVFTENGE